MSKYTGVGENQGSHCRRKKMKIWTGGKEEEPHGIGLELGDQDKFII